MSHLSSPHYLNPLSFIKVFIILFFHHLLFHHRLLLLLFKPFPCSFIPDFIDGERTSAFCLLVIDLSHSRLLSHARTINKLYTRSQHFIRWEQSFPLFHTRSLYSLPSSVPLRCNLLYNKSVIPSLSPLLSSNLPPCLLSLASSFNIKR